MTRMKVIRHIIHVCLVSTLFLAPSTLVALGLLPDATIITLTNEFRAEHNLPMLTESELLNQAARMKAEDMAEQGYFSHVGPDGKTPVEWLADVNYSYAFAGENIAVGTAGYITVEQAIELWKNSEGHRANMLSKQYTQIGVGIREGLLNGQPSIFYVQVFAHPRGVNPEPIQEVTPVEEVSHKEEPEIVREIVQEVPIEVIPPEEAVTIPSVILVENSSTTTDEDNGVDLPVEIFTYSLLILLFAVVLKKVC